MKQTQEKYRKTYRKTHIKNIQGKHIWKTYEQHNGTQHRKKTQEKNIGKNVGNNIGKTCWKNMQDNNIMQ